MTVACDGGAGAQAGVRQRREDAPYLPTPTHTRTVASVSRFTRFRYRKKNDQFQFQSRSEGESGGARSRCASGGETRGVGSCPRCECARRSPARGATLLLVCGGPMADPSRGISFALNASGDHTRSLRVVGTLSRVSRAIIRWDRAVREEGVLARRSSRANSGHPDRLCDQGRSPRIGCDII